MKPIPNFISKYNQSNAEVKIYNKISQLVDYDNWYCLHSLNLSRHISKREGEIDFLIIGPEGVFVLEVKGGRVARINGRWCFTDKYGHTTEKNESPFSQAKSAFYSLRSDIESRFGNLAYQTVMGYGVMFTDIEFNECSPEWSTEMIYDIRDNIDNISNYIKRLVEFWQFRQKSKKTLSPIEIHDLVNYLRGNFEKIIPLSSMIGRAEAELLKLTQKQYELLDSLDDNHRTIFIGGAGTGKTLLALEKLKRNSHLGLSTLFLCYNKLLAEYVQNSIESSGEFITKNIKVASIHSYMYSCLSKDEVMLRKLNNGLDCNYFNKLMPELFISLKAHDLFEEIIIDEMQDILSDSYLGVINCLVKGGIERGKWLICMDPENQQLYGGSPEVLNKLYKLGTSFKLKLNCRNTRQISEQTEAITGICAGKDAPAQGKSVKYMYFENDMDQALKISNYLNQLIEVQGLKPEDIVILSPNSSTNSLAGSGRLRLNYQLHDINKNPKTLKINNHISFSTIASFKGLESPVVVLTDINELSDKNNSKLNYVGYTRAKSYLVVSLNKKLRKEVADLFGSYVNIYSSGDLYAK